MAISVDLIGAQVPQLVQIVVSATANGVGWELTGSAAGTEWTVPGGQGIGDGLQLVLVDNRAPLNTPVTYTYTPATGSPQVAADVVVTSEHGMVLQTLDGQMSIGVDLLIESGDLELAPRHAVFDIPGRARPVVRFDVTGDGGGAFRVRIPTSETDDLRRLTASGAPILMRRADMSDDMPLVMVVLLTSISSSQSRNLDHRVWVLPYVMVDDPFLDIRLGAYSWDYVDGKLATRTWAQLDTLFSGKSWNAWDQYDWAGL